MLYEVITTGTKSTYKRLKKKIKKNIGQNNIDWLVLTHTHFDHCQNAYNLKKDFNCDIVASIKESEYTKSGFTPIPNGTNFLTVITSYSIHYTKLYDMYEVIEKVEKDKKIESLIFISYVDFA